MITKARLLDLIGDLMVDIDELSVRLDDLEKEVHKPKPIKKGTNVDGVKRKPGRPKKQK